MRVKNVDKECYAIADCGGDEWCFVIYPDDNIYRKGDRVIVSTDGESIYDRCETIYDILTINEFRKKDKELRGEVIDKIDLLDFKHRKMKRELERRIEEIATYAIKEIANFPIDDRYDTIDTFKERIDPAVLKALDNSVSSTDNILGNKRTVESNKKYKIGDKISFALTTGEEIEAIAIKENNDGMLFITVDCLKDEYRMFDDYDYPVAYKNSYVRHVLNNDILNTFPEEIKCKMIKQHFTVDDVTYDDYIRIPTEMEIFGRNEYGVDEEGTEQFEIMKDRRNRIAFKGSKTNELEWYWLMNVVSANYFAFVNSYGSPNSSGASTLFGVRPLFQLSNI